MEPLVASSISIGITANDMQKSLHFYKDGLGFELGRTREESGKITFAVLKAGGGEISIGQDDFAKGRDRAKGVGMRIWIRTSQDVVAIANRAKAAGIALDGDPAPLPWGPLAFQVTDPDGFKITVVTAAS
jgi:uncharacterized glyoxalase superfamily protein PhnB